MTESESEFQFSDQDKDNMVPENDRIDASKDCSEEEISYMHLMRRQEQTLDDDDQSSITDSETEFQFSEDKGDNNVPDSQCDRPLYPGTNLTIYEYHVKVFQFALKHNLTKHAYGDLLNLIQSVLPSSNSAITSLFKSNSLFSNIIDPNKVIHHHKYCSFCHHLMMKTDDVNGKCPNGCDDTIEEFMICDIEIQMKYLMSDPFVWNSLQSRFKNDAKLSDIFGGTEYRKLMEPEQFLSKPENITFCLNTDGVAVFKSSTTQIWPIWLQINELPPKMRFSKKYLILAGIWISKDKPTMESYMHPLVEKVNELYYDGVDVDTPIGKRKAHAAIIVCSTDRPACALVANNMQYNGHFGCTTCDSYGTSVGRTVYWPYDDASNLRTHQSILSSALEAVQCRKPVQGIKGVPILSLHPPFNLVKGMAVDDLHCVDLGVVKTLCTHWFSADKRGQPYSIYEKIEQCNENRLKIKVPNAIRRRPRSLHLIKKWKGSEFRSWLLYYSIPILKDVLPAQYFDHYLLLVVSMYILRGNCITEFELELSEACLNRFYVQFTDLYGITSTTMNVHLLTHLPFYVRAWDPLWTTSCYCFESANGTLRKFFHGTRNMSKQILYSFSMFQLLSHLKPSANSRCKKLD